MNPVAERYLKVFRANLKAIPEYEKNDIIHEIETHINMGLNKQETIEIILDKLGKPETLAHSYTNEYFLNNNIAKPSLIYNFLFYGFAGFTGMVVIPTLAIVAVVFAAFGLLIPVVGLTNIVGITHIPYVVMGQSTMAPLPALIVGVVVGVVLLLLALQCRKLLQKYCRFISGKYHKIRVNS